MVKSKNAKNSLDLYKALRSSHEKHLPNLNNIKRKFLKNNSNKINSDANQLTKQNNLKKSVFSNEDFESICPK